MSSAVAFGAISWVAIVSSRDFLSIFIRLLLVKLCICRVVFRVLSLYCVVLIMYFYRFAVNKVVHFSHRHALSERVFVGEAYTSRGVRK